MADIFLSYAEKDRPTAQRLSDALSAEGWVVWWDRRIPAGETWRKVLSAELSKMRCMVVLWSTNSIESDWVCEEAEEGRKLGKLIPVLIELVRPPAGFREMQAAELIHWNGSNQEHRFRILVDEIAHRLGKPIAPPDASAATPASRSNGGIKALQHWPWVAGIALAIAGTIAVFYPKAPGEAVDAPAPVAANNGRLESGSPATPLPPSERASQEPAPPHLVPFSSAAAPAPGAEASASLKSARKADTPAHQVNRQEVSAAGPGKQDRCDRLKERLSLGDLLSEDSQAFLTKECKQ